MPRYSSDDLTQAARRALSAETDPGRLAAMRKLKQTAQRLVRLEQQRAEAEEQRDQLIYELTNERVSRLALAGLAQRTPDRIDAIRRARQQQTR
jgi:hypothetical protein